MNKILSVLAVNLFFTACSLDREPHDALSTSTFPKTEEDLEMMAVGCYDGYVDQNYLVYNDVMSDNGICAINTNYAAYANGKTTPSVPGIGWYDYSTITRCNNFLHQANTKDIKFRDPKRFTHLVNEVRFIRAWRYYMMATAYGDVPLVKEIVPSLEEAKLPTTPEKDVVKFIMDELDDLTIDGALDVKAKEGGRITTGAALALQMRIALYYKDYERVITAADKIKGLGIYDLYKSGIYPYSEVFKEANEDNCEIILAFKRVMNDYKNQTIIEFCNVIDGGWSAFVPLQGLVDAYEMADGKTIEEAEVIGEYNPSHPFINRDPRLKATILYSGADWCNHKGVKRIFNTLDREIDGVSNKDHRDDSRNASQTSLIVRKYMNPLTQYSDINNTGLDMIIFRYAEVLLSKAEALIELNRDLGTATDLIDQVRKRAGMPKVDRTKYNNQIKLRELLRRERRVEFAFEGLRRDDIVRWDIAKDVLNGPAYASNTGTVNMDLSVPENERATINQGKNAKVIVEMRAFKNKYLPIPQSELDKNPNLKQTNFHN